MIRRIRVIYFCLCAILLLMVVTLSIVVGVREFAGPEYGLSFDDWPNGRGSDADHWHEGIFLNRKADKIRWVGKDEGIGVSSVRFFARIPLDEPGFQDLLEGRKHRSTGNNGLSSLPFDKSVVYIPDWFPKAHQISFFGTADGHEWFRAEGPYLFIYLDQS
nr:hypothetical protein [uncultured bacterium]